MLSARIYQVWGYMPTKKLREKRFTAQNYEILDNGAI